MSETEALLPCPFCGDKGWLVGMSKCFVACGNPKCNAEGPEKVDPDNARAAWNRRALPSRDAVPPGVYYDAKADNFYHATDRRGMGMAFWQNWRGRKEDFPKTGADAIRALKKDQNNG